jgi:hypothetical protein
MKSDFEECFWVYFIFLQLFLIESESEIKMKINGRGGGGGGGKLQNWTLHYYSHSKFLKKDG